MLAGPAFALHTESLDCFSILLNPYPKMPSSRPNMFSETSWNLISSRNASWLCGAHWPPDPGQVLLHLIALKTLSPPHAQPHARPAARSHKWLS